MQILIQTGTHPKTKKLCIYEKKTSFSLMECGFKCNENAGCNVLRHVDGVCQLGIRFFFIFFRLVAYECMTIYCQVQVQVPGQVPGQVQKVQGPRIGPGIYSTRSSSSDRVSPLAKKSPNLSMINKQGHFVEIPTGAAGTVH